MVLRRALVFLFVSLLGINMASAQVVHRDEIETFVGVLEVERTGARWDDWRLTTSDFVSWSTKAEDWSIDAWRTIIKEFPGRFIGGVGSGLNGPLPIRNTDLVAIPLNDKHGHERQFRVITFWKCEGDSLRVGQIMPKVFVGGLSELRVVDQLALRNESAIVVVGNYSGGEGDLRGDYEFLLLNTETLNAELLYTESFYYESSARCDTLSFHLLESNEGVQVEFYREEIDFELGNTEPRKWQRVSVGVDTTYVRLIK